MSTRVLIGWHEIVDGDFYSTDGLCEDMDSQNPIDFFNRFFEEEMWQHLVEKAGHWRTALRQFFFLAPSQLIQQYVMELRKLI